MMNSWTIRQRILGSFFSILLLLVVMGALAFSHLRSIESDATTIATDSALGTIISYQLQTEVMDNYARLQRLRFVTDKAELSRIEAEMMAGHGRQDALIKHYEDSIVQQTDRELWAKFQEVLPAYRTAQLRVLKVSSTLGAAQLVEPFDEDFVPHYAKVRGALTAVIQRNEKYTDSTVDNVFKSIRSASRTILLCTAIIFVLALLTGFFLLRAISQPLQKLVVALDLMRQGDFTGRIAGLRRDEFGIVGEGFNRMSDELAALVGQVQKSGLQVNTSVTQIAATSREQQATATEIAATTAEIGATSTEISATSRQLVMTMNDVSAVAEQSAALAGDGQAGLAHMAETMSHVMAATKNINGKLVVLNEKAGNINQVITTISKVAEQTNLLSLNAAIEAEKAGEHGRGFSVVATEIRRLADQTAVATYDIGQTVKEIQAAVSSSVMGMDKFSDEVRRGMDEVQQVSGQLSKIIQQVQTLAPRVEEVNDGMQAQAMGAEQITQALVQLNDSAQQTVESLRQSSMAIDDLNQVALSLRGGVSRFKLRN